MRLVYKFAFLTLPRSTILCGCQFHSPIKPNGVFDMRSCLVFACTLLGAIAVATIITDSRSVAESPKPPKQLRFLLLPTETKDQVKAVPFDQDRPIPKNGTLVTCDSLRFSSDGMVFEGAMIETEDQKTTAKEATFVVSDASIRFSDEAKIYFKSSKGHQDLLNALSR